MCKCVLTFGRPVVHGEYDDDRQQNHAQITRVRYLRSWRRHGHPIGVRHVICLYGEKGTVCDGGDDDGTRTRPTIRS